MSKGLVAVMLVLGLAGCSIRTKNVRLDLPAHAAVTPIAGRSVVLEPVVDDRIFTDAPTSSGNTMKPGFLKSLGPEKTAALIYGVGDESKGYAVLLPDGQSVANLVHGLVAGIFEAKGYTVYRDDAGHQDAPHVEVRITQFYLNRPFNFLRAMSWTLQMKAVIVTDVTVSLPQGRRTFTVSGRGANIVQTDKDANYQETYAEAMNDYTSDFNTQVFVNL